MKYVHAEGFSIDPLPKLELVGEDEKKNSTSDLLISTGGYIPAL